MIRKKYRMKLSEIYSSCKKDDGSETVVKN